LRNTQKPKREAREKFSSFDGIEIVTLNLNSQRRMKTHRTHNPSQKMCFLFYCADHHKSIFDFQSSNSRSPPDWPITLSLTLISSSFFYCCIGPTPMALCYFSYHLIIIAVCTIASFFRRVDVPASTEGLKKKHANNSEIGMKLNSREHRQWHLFHHVLFWVFLSLFPVIRSLGALPFNECYLICEVNWHVFIRHHVIKSNLRHPRFFAFCSAGTKKNIQSFIKILNFM
jgi:hypothetical protein